MFKHLFTLLLLFSIIHVKGQDSIQRPSRVVVKPAYLAEMLPQTRLKSPWAGKDIDSIYQEATALKMQNDSLLLLINDELTRSQALEQQNLKLAEENKTLSRNLRDAEGEQLQTSHTSSVLLIFNIIAGVILLVTLIWIFTRKKEGPETLDVTMRPVTSLPGNGGDPVEIRLERIEKLGRLRDKGLLTEDEFQLQKKQLLG